MVRNLAKKYSGSDAVMFDDLLQEGRLGALEAIRRFDPSKGAQLSTYAHGFARSKIMHFLRDKKDPVRVPSRQWDKGVRTEAVELDENVATKEFVTAEGERLPVKILHGSIWLSQETLVRLFGIDQSTVAWHMNQTVYALQAKGQRGLRRRFAVSASNGRTYRVKHYSLSVVIEVGYRVRSAAAERFRTWATEQVKAAMFEAVANG